MVSKVNESCDTLFFVILLMASPAWSDMPAPPGEPHLPLSFEEIAAYQDFNFYVRYTTTSPRPRHARDGGQPEQHMVQIRNSSMFTLKERGGFHNVEVYAARQTEQSF